MLGKATKNICLAPPPDPHQPAVRKGNQTSIRESATLAEASCAMPRRSTLPTQVQYPEDREQGCAKTRAVQSHEENPPLVMAG